MGLGVKSAVQKHSEDTVTQTSKSKTANIPQSDQITQKVEKIFF